MLNDTTVTTAQVFNGPGVLAVIQPIASKHWRKESYCNQNWPDGKYDAPCTPAVERQYRQLLRYLHSLPCIGLHLDITFHVADVLRRLPYMRLGFGVDNSSNPPFYLETD